MNVKLDPDLVEKLKKQDIRIRQRFKQRILIFQKNPTEPLLNNHPLKDPYKGLRSINITNDYRAIYEEILVGESIVAYFVLFGTHAQLYKN
jgi:addiction module RelE/StbE family toxin